MGYKTRKRLSMLVLLVGLPLYIVVAVKVVSLFERPPILLELLVYIVLGFLWMMPMRKIFLGVGKPDPEANPKDYPHDPAGKYALKDEET